MVGRPPDRAALPGAGKIRDLGLFLSSVTYLDEPT
jgi:hypothetical protein